MVPGTPGGGEGRSDAVRQPRRPEAGEGASGVRLGNPQERYVAPDVGASTGGFTDCCSSTARRRWGTRVDVGYGQLHWRLRNDPRVVVMERTNARHLKPGDSPEPVDWVVIDVSFISLAKIFPAVVP